MVLLAACGGPAVVVFLIFRTVQVRICSHSLFIPDIRYCDPQVRRHFLPPFSWLFFFISSQLHRPERDGFFFLKLDSVKAVINTSQKREKRWSHFILPDANISVWVYSFCILLKPIIAHKFVFWDFVQLQLTFICSLALILTDTANNWASNCSSIVFTSSSKHFCTSNNRICVFEMHSSAVFGSAWSQNAFIWHLLRQCSTI